MTETEKSPAASGRSEAESAVKRPDLVKKVDTVTLTIDGIEVEAPKGELLIRTAERLGIAIPRFCDHPLLDPVGACRQCLVEVEGQRKPVASCTQPVAPGMVVHTQLTSPVAKKAQAGIIEFLLINHPLDCPMCDKGGECPLQNQAMSTGRTDTRFHDIKRTYAKPLAISSQVLLDRERCVLCQRCTRFSEQIAGDKFIDLMDRSAAEQINIFPGDEFQSYFSGNTIQICPVGALTGTQYRFRSRPFDLVSTPSACEHCAAGCALRTDWRRNTVLRRLAGDDPEVNEEWNCDKGRWAIQYANAPDRLVKPLVRDAETGALREASWPEALAVAAEGLRGAKEGTGVGVLTGGRLTLEDSYAYAKFARVVLGTNDIDFRARPLSAEETVFLASAVAGRYDVHYSDIDKAPAVVIAGLEPEEECPILFLRLRKANRRRGLQVHALAPYLTAGFVKLATNLHQVVPGGEAALLAGDEGLRAALSQPGAVLVVGERLATVPGALSAAAALAERTGAKLAWVPRRAGDRGAIEAGCLPNLLPGARPVIEPAARAELTQAWGLDTGALPHRPGRDTDEMLAAAASGELGALIVAGVDPDDLADPLAAAQALERVPFLINLELRPTAVTHLADVVFPVAPTVEKAGTFVDWEGRPRGFERILATTAISDARVLDTLAREFGVELGCGDAALVRRELNLVPATLTSRVEPPAVAPAKPVVPAKGEAVLATWPHLIDSGVLVAGEQYLAGTARTPVVRVSKAVASDLGVAEGDPVTVGTDRGEITLPAALTPDLPDTVVWLPTNSPGSAVRRTLGVLAGATVRLARAEITPPDDSAGGTR